MLSAKGYRDPGVSWGPKGRRNIRMLRRPGETGIPKLFICRILMFMWPLVRILHPQRTSRLKGLVLDLCKGAHGEEYSGSLKSGPGGRNDRST